MHTAKRHGIERQIIADRSAAAVPPAPGWFWLVAALAAAVGVAAAWHYARLDLTLSHYDAKAHLVVARRIADSLTPGWVQIGAIWLPLPHVLNFLPVQIDAWFRSGLSGIVISVVSFAVATGAVSWFVLAATGSRAAALLAALVLASDPDVLYLQSTPMTEPLLLAGLTGSLALTWRWLEHGRGLHAAGWCLALSCLTRYEAWPVTALLLGLAAVAKLRQGTPLGATARALAPLAVSPLPAVAAFMVLSRVSVGAWFVTGGFYVAENEAHGRPLQAIGQVAWGAWQVLGPITMTGGTLGLVLAAALAVRRAALAPLLLSLALAGTGALPWYAFVTGHPFRIRYMVVLVAAAAVGLGLLVARLPRFARPLAAVVLAGIALVETPPLWSRAPMVLEAQWDRRRSGERQAVTRCLEARFRRPEEKVLASMGSLAHFMQELSHAGFVLRDFVHEGNGELWPAALESPVRHVEWILFEEHAEGGDMLTERRRADPSFVQGFERLCEGGGVALYRRD
jgi:hypothetical protein